MASNHVLELPKFVWALKIVQLVLSVLVLGLAAFNVDMASYSAHALSVFAALFSIIILVYYFVAVHAVIALYNWIALLVLESLAVVFWLSTWAALAALYNTPLYYYGTYWWQYKRSLEKRATLADYNGTFISAITFSVLLFILYCVTLVFMAIGAHRHQRAGRPMRYGGTGNAATADLEQPAPAAPETTQYTGPPIDQTGRTQPAAVPPQQEEP